MKAKSRFEAVLATAIACVCVVCADAAEQIGLSVLHFRPLDAELNKFLKPVQRKSVNSEPMKLTPQEMACLDSQDATALKLANFWERMQARKAQMQKDEEAYRKQEEQIEKLRDTMFKTAENRPLFYGMKKLNAKLSQYGVFKILERNDMAEMLNEANSESQEKQEQLFALARMASSYNIIVDVEDLHHQEQEGTVGGVSFRDTTYSRKFVLKVQNMLDGTQEFSNEVMAKRKRTITDVGGTFDSGTVYDELVDDAVEQMAKLIYEHFVASCTFKFKPIGKIEGFEPSAITISVLDGKNEPVATPSDGETVDIRKGSYTFKVEGEYLFAGGKDSKKVVIGSSKTFTESFEKAMQEVEFTFKAGGDAFPSVTLTPKGWEGDPVEITSAGPAEIRKGAYVFEAMCDGFKDMKGSLNVTSTMKKYDFKMTKAPVEVPVEEGAK